jgi:hypothetical protein
MGRLRLNPDRVLTPAERLKRFRDRRRGLPVVEAPRVTTPGRALAEALEACGVPVARADGLVEAQAMPTLPPRRRMSRALYIRLGRRRRVAPWWGRPRHCAFLIHPARPRPVCQSMCHRAISPDQCRGIAVRSLLVLLFLLSTVRPAHGAHRPRPLRFDPKALIG